MPPKPSKPVSSEKKPIVQKQTKTSYAQKPQIQKKTWYDIVTEEEKAQAQKETSSSQSEKDQQILEWVKSLQQNPELALAFSETNPKLLSQQDVPFSQNFLLSTLSPGQSSQNVEKIPIQVLKTASQQALQLNKEKEIVLASPKSAKQYFENPRKQFLAYIEPEFAHHIPRIVASKIFQNDFHYSCDDARKNQIFYEFVLVDTDSIEIKHYPSKSDPQSIDYSTLQICKVLSPSDWGNTKRNKKFTQPFDPMGYSYTDYQKAWYNVFFFQNNHFRHSWMIYFKKNTNFKFPFWFTSWWAYFEPQLQILPPQILQGFQNFDDNYQKTPSEEILPNTLLFYSKFSLAWILLWDYEQVLTNKIPSLTRKFKTKWWSKFDATHVTESAIKQWLRTQTQTVPTIDQATAQFLRTKNLTATELSGVKSKSEMKAKLKSIMAQLENEEDEEAQAHDSSNNESIEDLAQDNEDDCYGLL